MSRADRTPPTAQEYLDFQKRFCNWGRWPGNEELGTLNFITPAIRAAAASEVREGVVVSCGRPLNTRSGPANPYPAYHFVAVDPSVGRAGGQLDYIGMFLHGHGQTHLDALGHMPIAEGGVTWNGVPLNEHRLPVTHSATIDFLRAGIVGRGVLYDVAAHRGVPSVPPGDPIHGWELDDIAAATGVAPRSGDVVAVRGGPPLSDDHTMYRAGLHASCLEFLYDTEASALVWDTGDAPIEDQDLPHPAPALRGPAAHVHHIALPYMGMPVLDHANLEELAVTCERLRRRTFMFVAAPLVIERGTGSPINPLAMF